MFADRVYDACRRIPVGMVSTYAEVARAAGSPGAARAAGQVLKRNPYAPVVPCHRVVASDGSLHGFSGRMDNPEKAGLLRKEGVAIENGRVDLGKFGYRF